MRLLPFLAGILLAAAGCTGTLSPAPEPVYHVMRHLHTPAGERDPDLLPEGSRQAERLARDWAGAPPRAVYVSHYKRTRQSAAPLAARFGLTPIVYDPADTPALVARVRAGPLPAFIVGHSNTVPDIVEQLGGARPGALAHEDFGDVWSIGADGATQRRRIAE